MPVTLQEAFDRIATVVASTASLDASPGSPVDSSGNPVFLRHPARLDLDDIEDTAIHRRFHVILESVEPPAGMGRRFAGSLTDTDFSVVVQLGYFDGGGDAVPTYDRHGIDRLASSDLVRLVSHVEHPDNYDQGTTGIQLVQWIGTRRVVVQSRKRIYESRFRVWVEHNRLT